MSNTFHLPTSYRKNSLFSYFLLQYFLLCSSYFSCSLSKIFIFFHFLIMFFFLSRLCVNLSLVDFRLFVPDYVNWITWLYDIIGYYVRMTHSVSCITGILCDWWTKSPEYVKTGDCDVPICEMYHLGMSQWVKVSPEYDEIGDCVTCVCRNSEMYQLGMLQWAKGVTWIWRNWWTVSPAYDAISELCHRNMTHLVY